MSHILTNWWRVLHASFRASARLSCDVIRYSSISRFARAGVDGSHWADLSVFQALAATSGNLVIVV